MTVFRFRIISTMPGFKTEDMSVHSISRESLEDAWARIAFIVGRLVKDGCCVRSVESLN